MSASDQKRILPAMSLEILVCRHGAYRSGERRVRRHVRIFGDRSIEVDSWSSEAKLEARSKNFRRIYFSVGVTCRLLTAWPCGKVQNVENFQLHSIVVLWPHFLRHRRVQLLHVP